MTAIRDPQSAVPDPQSAVRDPRSAVHKAGAWFRDARFGRSAVVVAAVVFVLAAAWPSASQPDDDVLKVIPENYRLLFENSVVRVIEARVPPGTEEPPHRHMRGVSVCMTEYTIESRAVPDGTWVRSERKLGTVYWSEGSLHQLRNVGTTQSHTIRVELKF